MSQKQMDLIILLILCLSLLLCPGGSWRLNSHVGPLHMVANKREFQPSTSRRAPASYGNRNGDANDQAGSQPQRADPWKVLIKKLGTTKESKETFGKVVKPASPAGAVDELQCKHFDSCAGCVFKSNFTDSPMMFRAKTFFKAEGVNLNIQMGQLHEWRTHVKLAVQPMSKWGGLKFGLYKAGSHEVESIPECRVHHPRINEAAEELRTAALDVRVKGFAEASAKSAANGELRYIQLTLDRVTKKIQLVLVWNTPSFRDSDQTLPRLLKRLKARPDLWHSVTVNFNTGSGNNIFDYNPKNWKTLWGPPFIKEKVGGATFSFRPQIFRQANLDMFEKAIIPAVLRHIPKNSRISELYSGLGIIGINAAVSMEADVVYCSDSNAFVNEIFDNAVESIADDEIKERIFFESMSADDAVEAGQCDEADVLIVDPPRRGLTDGVKAMLLGTHAEVDLPSSLRRLIYVGCGYEAVERDTRELLDSGLWTLKSAEGFALFPGSDHIEMVTVYQRTGKKAPARTKPRPNDHDDSSPFIAEDSDDDYSSEDEEEEEEE